MAPPGLSSDSAICVVEIIRSSLPVVIIPLFAISVYVNKFVGNRIGLAP
jgi:hypothetical protein